MEGMEMDETEVEVENTDPGMEPTVGEEESIEVSVTEQAGPPPVPESPIQVSAVQKLVQAINAAAGFLMPNAREVRYQAPKAVTATKDAVPPDVWVTLWALGTMLQSLSGMPGAEVLARYAFDPQSIRKQAAMQDITSKLNILARDEKARDFLQKAIAEQVGGPPEAPSREDVVATEMNETAMAAPE